MKRPVLFILLGGLAVGSGLLTYRIKSRAALPSAAPNPTNSQVLMVSSNLDATIKATNGPVGSTSNRVDQGDSLKRLASNREVGALRFDNPDLVSVLQELEKKSLDLNRREQELKQLSERLVAEQAALQSLTSRVASMQQRLDESIRLRLDKIRQAERERREATGRKWAALQPGEVVTLAVGLPPDETLAVLRTLPRETASKIVEALAKNGSSGARQLVDMMQQALSAPDDRSAKP